MYCTCTVFTCTVQAVDQRKVSDYKDLKTAFKPTKLYQASTINPILITLCIHNTFTSIKTHNSKNNIIAATVQYIKLMKALVHL